MQVTQVTVNATKHPLTDADYRDIFDELKDKGISLETFIEISGSLYSKAQWSKYARNLIPLNRVMKADLLRAVGEKPLPLTVAEATATADPDASVWQVGEGAAAHVIMVGQTPVTLHINGDVKIVEQAQTVTQGTRTRKEYVRPCISLERAEMVRMECWGYSWDDIICIGIAAIVESRREQGYEQPE